MMRRILLSLVCAFVALAASAVEVVDLYKDFTTTQNIDWGSEVANARISYSNTDGLVYHSTEATTNNWDAQYWVANGNTFAPENTYKVTMMIKGSVAGTIGNLKLGDWNQGVDNYGKFNIPEGEFQEVSIDVTGVPGGDGVILQTGSYVGNLCIKWIKITHNDSRDAGKLCLALTDIPAGTEVWDHKLQYPFAPSIPAGSYTLSIDVKGDAEGSMSIWGDYVEGAYYGPDLSFGTTWQTKNIDFNLEKDYKQFALLFGKYTGSKLFIDNIKITKKEDGSDVVAADFASATLDGFKVSGFWTNVDGWVEHKAKSTIIETPENFKAAVSPEGVGYVLTGDPVDGDKDPSVIAALADANATYYDGTLLVNSTAVQLEAANPNAIFAANNGVLANANNVMIDTTIANLALTDGKPFKAPAGASATTVSYDRTLTAAYSTVCLPVSFSVAGAAIYEFTSMDGNTVTFTEVANTTAGVPYLVKGTGTITCSGGTLAAADDSGAFKGTYVNKVLNSDASTTYYGFSGGKFVRVSSNVNAKPFRAYLETSTSASVKSFDVNFGEEDAISNIVEDLNNAKEIYNVNGVRQNGLQKGINIIKMANGATRKVILK